MNQFNIRVYGICVQAGRLLVTDERRFGISMTKLPGGGLHFGEGLERALKREWKEELNAEIRVGDIFFVNPFLQISAFNPSDEVIGLYFWVTPLRPLDVRFTERPMQFSTAAEEEQVFRWIALRDLRETDFTFPIDQALVPRLRKHFGY